MSEINFYDHVAKLRRNAIIAVYDVADTENAAAAGSIRASQYWDEEVERAHAVLYTRIETFALALVSLCEREGFLTLSKQVLNYWHANKTRASAVGYYDFPSGPEAFVLERLKELSDVLPLSRKKTVEQHAVVANVLEQLGATMQRLGRTTKKEKDVQDVLEAVMRAAFPDVISYPSTSKQTKNFVPDLGIETSGIAIELKFAGSLQKAKDALGGIYEDMKGYAGDRYWRDFIGCIYMHQAYLTQKQIDAELAKVGCPKNWSVKVVIGP